MALLITWDQIKIFAKDIEDDLDLFTAAEQNLILGQVELDVKEAEFRSKTLYAQLWYAAHISAMAIGPAAGEGTRASESIGGVSTGVTLAVNNPKATENLLSTVYGREFYRIMNSMFVGFYVG